MKLSDDQKRYIEELFELLKIPSISADSKFKKEFREKYFEFIENTFKKVLPHKRYLKMYKLC